MPLVAAKCTQCGADLQVDNSQDAAVCQHCGTPFIVEKAINNYNTYVTQNFAGAQVTIQGANIDSYIERAFMFLEEKKWENAYDYAEKSLDIDPKCTKAYIIKYMADKRILNTSLISEVSTNPSLDTEFKKALKYDDGTAKTILEEWYSAKYAQALAYMNKQSDENGFLLAVNKFDEIGDYSNAKVKASECRAEAEKCRISIIRNKCKDINKSKDISFLVNLLKELDTVNIPEKDELKAAINNRIDKLNSKFYKKLIIVGILIVLGIVAYFVSLSVKKANQKKKEYEVASVYYEKNDYYAAYSRFLDLGDYKDSSQRANDALDLYREETERNTFLNEVDFVKDSIKYNKFGESKQHYEKLLANQKVTSELKTKELDELNKWLSEIIQTYFDNKEWQKCIDLCQVYKDYLNISDILDEANKQIKEEALAREKEVEEQKEAYNRSIVYTSDFPAPSEYSELEKLLKKYAKDDGAAVDDAKHISIQHYTGTKRTYSLRATKSGENVTYTLVPNGLTFDIMIN